MIKMKNNKNSGQIFSADFLVAITVILFIMTSLQVYHSRVLEEIKQEERMIFRESLSSRTDTLLLFEGQPKNWDRNNVEVLGFSTGTPNELNETKLVEYFSMEEERAENLLGFHGRNFNLSVMQEEILENGDIKFTRGDGDWDNADDVYTIERTVSLDDREGAVSLRLVVW